MLTGSRVRLETLLPLTSETETSWCTSCRLSPRKKAALAVTETSVECFCKDTDTGRGATAARQRWLACWLAGDHGCTNAHVVHPDVQLPDYRQERCSK